MGQLGRQLEKAHAEASSALGGLSVMIERGHGSPTMLRIEADKLDRAARIIREAVGDE